MSDAEDQARSYDEVPYESGPFSYTHPDALASVATLHGMDPPRVDGCRVLELGCAEGGNLIPMAVSLPGSRFVGVDLSPRQVASGRAIIDRLGLRNIELREMDLMKIDAGLGEFDYIVCHGVYSWVPRPVQDKILSICAERLSAEGVAYVSYNTYPGWFSRGMVREMVNYHVDRKAPPLERVRQARQFLDFLVSNCREPKAIYCAELGQEARLWQKASDSYLLHEQLAEFNEPLFFHQFVGRLREHGLQFVAEAKLAELPGADSDDVSQAFAAWGLDGVRREQHLDFLADRTFRRSLICRDRVRLKGVPEPDVISKFLLVAKAMPVADAPQVASESIEQFRTREGATFSTNNPWLKAALVALFELWPRPLPFAEVCRQARSLLEQSESGEMDPLGDPRLLKQPLLQCGLSGLAELHVHASPDVTEIDARPRASPLARLQAETNHIVTNLRHHQIELMGIDREVLLQLDGERDLPALEQIFRQIAAEAEEAAKSAQADLPAEGAAAPEPNRPPTLQESLRRLAATGLLLGRSSPRAAIQT